LYRLVVLDVDDTIVSAQKEISVATREAILAAVRQGTLVTLASGRMYQAMRRTARELEITLPLIACNGAVVQDEERILATHTLEAATAKKAMAFFDRLGLTLQLYKPEGIYSRERCERTWHLEEGEGVPCHLVSGAEYGKLYHGLIKLLIRLDEERAHQYQKELLREFGNSLSAATSHKIYLEITGRGVDKGAALRKLAGDLGIEAGEVLAIGDSSNDKTMLAWAGLGIAMGDAREDVKLVADEIAPAIAEDGVAAMLEKYILR
jgi:Cof subfamily protein (haloacid dehalogenase superfamily)